MTAARTLGTVPVGPTLAQRANDALLALTARASQQKSEAELAAITAACDRAEKAAAALQAIADTAAEFTRRDVPYALPSLPPAAGKSIPNLRAAATRVRDSDQNEDLTGRLKGGAVQDALKAAENLVKTSELVLRRAAESERIRLAEGSDRPVTSLPGRESVQAQAVRIQATLRQQAAGANIDELPAAIDRWRAAARAWKQVIHDLEQAVSELPTDIKAFVKAAATDGGAAWSLVTPAVRDWLDTDENGNGYGMRKW
jgi:hypothetical protein